MLSQFPVRDVAAPYLYRLSSDLSMTIALSKYEDGYITYIGRTDDVFKASDYRISPFELESVLLEHEKVAEAAVVPSPDPIRLAIPKAYVLLVAGTERSPETALSIFRHLHTRLAPFKRIRKIELVTELPQTISGKIVIEKGISPGETIVTDGQSRLFPGAKIAAAK